MHGVRGCEGPCPSPNDPRQDANHRIAERLELADLQHNSIHHLGLARATPAFALQ